MVSPAKVFDLNLVMSRSALILFIAWAPLAGGTLGCTTSEPGAGEGPSAQELREVPESKLPALADPSPTSNPAVEAAGPQGWKRLPRNDEQYLIGWYGGSNPNILPRIFVRVEDWDGEDTTPENAPALAAKIHQSLQSSKDVVEWPQPMLLGEEPWARYVVDARLGNAKAEKQILQRAAGGKLYTVELQIYRGKILESRDQAYAVAAKLNFEAGPAAESPAEPSAEPAADSEPLAEPSSTDSAPAGEAAPDGAP
jgi:hypothetical protein